jgi:hypothetical protein
MLKNISRLEHLIADRVYHFTCDMDAPLNDVKEAAVVFLRYIGMVEDQVKAAQAAQAVPVASDNVTAAEAPKPIQE